MKLSNQLTLIKRHKNPVGIFARIVIYPLLAYGLWAHLPWLIGLCLLLELLNWTAMPPVEKTLGFIQEAIDMEIVWWNADAGFLKTVSIVLLLAFPFVLFVGVWQHHWLLIAGGFALIIFFGVLMNIISNQAIRKNTHV